MLNGVTDQSKLLLPEHLGVPLEVFGLIACYVPAYKFVGSRPLQSTCKAWERALKDPTKRAPLSARTIKASCKTSKDALEVLSDPLIVKHLCVEDVLAIASRCDELIFQIIERPDILVAIARYPSHYLITYLGEQNLGFAEFLLSFHHRGLPINNGTFQICYVDDVALRAQHESLAHKMLNNSANYPLLTTHRLTVLSAKYASVKQRIQEISPLRDKLNSVSPIPAIPYPFTTTYCDDITQPIHLLALTLKNKLKEPPLKKTYCSIS